jgi:hypothetical protein
MPTLSLSLTTPLTANVPPGDGSSHFELLSNVIALSGLGGIPDTGDVISIAFTIDYDLAISAGVGSTTPIVAGVAVPTSGDHAGDFTWGDAIFIGNVANELGAGPFHISQSVAFLRSWADLQVLDLQVYAQYVLEEGPTSAVNVTISNVVITAASYATVIVGMSINPVSGITTGGDLITIVDVAGVFVEGATVTFGRYYGGFAQATDVVVVDSNTITCRTPAHVAQLCSVVISGLAGDDVILHDAFEFVAPDIIGGSGPGGITVDPTHGSVAGGTSVTITITGVAFSVAPEVFFGDVPATDIVLVSPSVITCTAPQHGAGPVTLRIQG